MTSVRVQVAPPKSRAKIRSAAPGSRRVEIPRCDVCDEAIVKIARGQRADRERISYAASLTSSQIRGINLDRLINRMGRPASGLSERITHVCETCFCGISELVRDLFVGMREGIRAEKKVKRS